MNTLASLENLTSGDSCLPTSTTVCEDLLAAPSETGCIKNQYLSEITVPKLIALSRPAFECIPPQAGILLSGTLRQYSHLETMHKNSVQTSFVGLCLLLCLVLTGRASDISDKQRWQATSEQGNFAVDLIASNSDIRIGEFLSWQLVIRHADSNQGVAPVRVVIGGGMPAHGHGLPTQPQVTAHNGEGQYQLDGLMFNMAGEWQLILQINTQKQSDRVIFDLTIDH